MSVLRFFAILVIFGTAAVGWMVLGGTLEYRTAALDHSLSEEVDSLWGPSGLTQPAPSVVAGGDERIDPERYVDPLASNVAVQFAHHNRYKGLLWFSTYTVQFTGKYTAKAPAGDAARAAPRGGLLIFRLPAEVERIAVTLDDQPLPTRYSAKFPHTLLVGLPDGGEHAVGISYEARGRDRWSYTPLWCDYMRPAGLRNFTLTAATNFDEIDYPRGSVSPVTPAKPIAGGRSATWRYDADRTSKWMGIEMPKRADAGPIAARMAFFAPVSLLFFFTVLFTISVLKKVPLHPMHYLFISAGFFAFHILLAYLVDIISIHAAFWICAAVSVFLVVSYMRLAAGVKVALTYVALSQLVFLVGFSYAFFWAGRTGLAITIGAIATLFFLMQATGRANWHQVFGNARGRGQEPPPFTPPAGPPLTPLP